MHVVVLTEEKSAKPVVESLLCKLLHQGKDTKRIVSHPGLGKLPSKKSNGVVKQKNQLLANLPNFLRAYGKQYEYDERACLVVVLMDADNKDYENFLPELNEIKNTAAPKLHCLFCFAVEELEAWYFGDWDAVRAAYARAKKLDYQQDSICGTWEKFADAVYPGGAQELRKLGYPQIGMAKCKWAENIAPKMCIEKNKSPSFNKFCNGIRESLA